MQIKLFIDKIKNFALKITEMFPKNIKVHDKHYTGVFFSYIT